MHIMITMKCNMKCGHCCYSCTEVGEDMSFDVFKASADLAHLLNDRIALCGGEPTIHPLFWKFMEYSISISDNVFCITNGKETTTALAIAKLGKKGVIHSELSLDKCMSQLINVL